MKKLALNLVAIACCLGLISWKTPDYRPAFAATQRGLTDLTKKGLLKLTGNQTLTYLGTKLSTAVLDTVNKYVKPINNFKMSRPYTVQDAQKVVNPSFFAITRFEKKISNTKLNNNQRVFALKVLIALKAGLNMPLQDVGELPPRDTFIKHDIFVESEQLNHKSVKIRSPFPYRAYWSGLRVAQAKGDARIVAYYMNQAYEEAGEEVAGKLNDIFFQLAYPAPPGSINEPLGDDDYDPVPPGQERVYKFGYAQFPGTDIEMKKFFNDHLVYPKNEWEWGMEGFVYASFIVEKDGSISTIEVKHGISPDIDAEVIRVLKLSPKWRPMEMEGKGAVRSEAAVRFYFLIYVDEQRKRSLVFDGLKKVLCSKTD
ncbi:hypothetical protein FO440_03955 [Mucilaginibacter corticis]|uniref:TonB C-terminal domain-containing protein n=1 Tax=Mucilaginibacter corticis TaxID=2597670 RepID=A0A556MTZ0_9SPHI|nr:energy transducer TonB [Mucilaginibacter corticis]TSJ43357.1 hypothetical protein FO440_03955 [Mucilaginibacter corticis]